MIRSHERHYVKIRVKKYNKKIGVKKLFRYMQVKRTHIVHLTSAHTRTDIRIFQKECRTLAQVSNNDVTLLVCDGLGNTVMDHVNIIDLGRPHNRINRYLNKPKQLLNYSKTHKPDIAHIHDPELLQIIPKLRTYGIHVIYDVHEDIQATARQARWIPRIMRPLASQIINFYEKKQSKKATGIIAATPHIRSRFEQWHKNSTVIYNYPEITITQISEKPSNHHHICYVGGITEIRGIRELITSLGLTKHPVQLDLVGSFQNKNFYQEISSYPEWKHVTFHGQIPHKKAMNIVSKSIAGIVPFLPVQNHLHALPNKLFEYMAQGIPVICSNIPLWEELIQHQHIGICFDPKNPKELAEAIDNIIDNPKKAKEMGIQAQQAITKTYNWETQAQKLIKFYQNMIT
jgi:glycosyltransferase involved in cell wall biosynthesis